MTRTPTRRTYLTASAVAGIAALAGCSDLIEDFESDEDPGDEDPDGEDSDEGTVDDVDHENPDGEVEFVEPEDGDEVSSPVEIELAVEGLELQPVDGEEGDEEGAEPEDGAGHHHVIVDENCVEPGHVIPQEDDYHHLEDGEEELELDLEPGEYDLCAQFADAQHNAYDMSDEIRIEVTDGDGAENGDDDGAENDDEDGPENDDGDDE